MASAERGRPCPRECAVGQLCVGHSDPTQGAIGYVLHVEVRPEGSRGHGRPRSDHSRCRLGSWLLLLSFGLWAANFTAFAMPIRVALMNFTVEELSYRSSKAAVDLTGVLQAELAASPPTGVEFVERAELDRAVAELQLGGVGLADRRDGLRAGHWARADWAVFGTLQTNRVGGGFRHLHLELVELARATVISATNLPVRSTSETHFSVAPREFDRLAVELGGWLTGEVRREPERRSALVIASLPLEGIIADMQWWTNPAAAVGTPLRHLSLDAARQATAETDFALAGLTLGVTNLPMPAEFIVWPTASRAVDPSSFVVWDGRGPSFLVRLTNGLSDLSSLGKVLVAIRAGRPAGPCQPLRREQLADHLALMAKIGMSPNAYRLRQYELAVWLAPTDPAIWEGWLRFRWDNPDFEPNADKFQRGEFNHERHRFEAWADYLDRFGKPHGALPPEQRERSPAAELVRAAIRAIEIAQEGDAKSEVGIPDDVGGEVLAEWRSRFVNGLISRLPQLLTQDDVRTNAADFLGVIFTDMGQGANGQEARRRIPAFERLWSLVREFQPDRLGVWGDSLEVADLFAGAGQPTKAAPYVAEAQAALKRREAAERQTPVKREPDAVIGLPRIHLLAEAGRQHFWTFEGANFRPPMLSHRAERIEFSPNDQVVSINTVGWAGGRLWLGGNSTAPAAPAPGGPPEVSGGFPEFSLWTVAGTNLTPRRVRAPAQVDLVAGFVADGDELWLPRQDGITAWNVVSQGARRLGTDEGLPPGRIWSVAHQGSRGLALGSDLAWSTNGGTTWHVVPGVLPKGPPRTSPSGTGLPAAVTMSPPRNVPRPNFTGPPAHASWPAVVSGEAWALGKTDGTFYSARFGRPAEKNAQLVQSRRGGWAAPTRLAASSNDGFWVAAQRGIHRVSPGSEPTKEIQVMELPGFGRFMPEFHAQLPRRATNGIDYNVIQGLARSLAARGNEPGAPMVSRLTEPVLAMVATGDFLWLASASYGREVVACYDTRRRGWVGVIPLPIKAHWLVLAGDHLGALRPPNQFENDRSVGMWLHLPSAKELAARPVMPDLISESELMAATEDLSPTQKAVVALFTGHPKKVLNLFDGSPADSLDPEAIALLALACDPHGLNRPEESLRWAELGRREYPQSVFIRAVWLDRFRRQADERLAARTTGEATPAALLRDYDASSDGALDLLELELGVACEPLRFRPKGGMIPSAHSLPTLLARFDRNQNQGLAADELELMLASPAARPPTGQP